MAGKPGMMFYAEDKEMLDALPDADFGRLVRVMMQYSEDGVEPMLPQHLSPFWPMLRKRVDTDTKRYNETVAKRRYATYCRTEKSAGREPMSLAEWKESDYHMISHDIKCNHMISHDIKCNHMISHDIQHTTSNIQPTTDNIQQATYNKQPTTACGVDVDAAWGEFWEGYPKHSGEAAARIAFVKATKIVSPVRIMEALRSWKASEQWTKDGGRFVPLPANWLDRHGWEENPPRRRDGITRHGDELTPIERAAVQRALAEGARIAEEDARLGQGIEGG